MNINDYKENLRSGRIGHYADPKEFFGEINYLMKVYNRSYHSINILEDSADGELWIIIDDRWYGYLDEWFYQCMENNTPPDDYLNFIDDVYEK